MTASTTLTTQKEPILTVSQLTQEIRLCLESNFSGIWLQGEISNCKLQSSGHLYFSLKDSQAQIGAVMFRGDLASVRGTPKDGDHVIVFGELNVYPPSGKYQLIVRKLRQEGLGELLVRLEELKIKLHKLGWFRSEHKKLIPKFPKIIGVVTSPTGAVIQDILHVLSRRFSGFHLILNPVKVQGEGAAQEIAQAIKQFNEYNLADVLIIGRGGGSLEDLWAFNEEIVAQAIFDSKIPIISAVGHETDHCIADYVADLRAPTPSAAAELVIAEKAHYLLQLEQLEKRIRQVLQQRIFLWREKLNVFLKHPLFQSPYTLLGPWMQRMDQLKEGLDFAVIQCLSRNKLLLESRHKQLEALRPTNKILHFKQKLVQFSHAFDQVIFSRQEEWRRRLNAEVKLKQLNQVMQRILSLKKEKFEQMKLSLEAVDPKLLLTKGYCILFSEKDNSVITTIDKLEKKEELRILLSDGQIISTIKDIILHE